MFMANESLFWGIFIFINRHKRAFLHHDHDDVPKNKHFYNFLIFHCGTSGSIVSYGMESFLQKLQTICVDDSDHFRANHGLFSIVFRKLG